MFVSTFLLDTKHHNIEKYLHKMFWCSFLMKNKLIKQININLSKLKCDTQYKNLISQYKQFKNLEKPTKQDKLYFKDICFQLNELIKSYGLTKAYLYKYLSVQQKKYKRYISSQMANAIADDVLQALEKVLYSDGKIIHFKKFNEIKTIAAKSLTNGIFVIYENNKLYIEFHLNRKNSLRIPVIIKDYDTYGKEVITNALVKESIKYATIKRQMFNNGYKYYVQFTINDIPPMKHTKGLGNCGLDIGVSSIASVSDDKCYLEDLAPNIKEYNNKIIKLQKQLERSKKINNKNCYNTNGTIKKGSKFIQTKNYKKLYKRYLTLCRKRNCYVKQTHCKLANNIIEHCNTIYYEEMNFKSLQKRSKTLERSNKTSIIKNKDGGTKLIKKFKRKKRFGKTLQNKAPSNFLTILKNKCEFYEIPIIGIKTKTFKASQYNHITDEYIKKPLSQRFNEFQLPNNENVTIQRDLYSAYLIKNSLPNLEQTDRTKCINDFEKFTQLHNECMEYVKQTNVNRLSCFGF